MASRYNSVGTAHIIAEEEPLAKSADDVPSRMWYKINWVPILQLAKSNQRMTKLKWKEWVKGAGIGKAKLEKDIIKMWDDPAFDDLDDEGWERAIQGLKDR
jgi:hypothetical protein